MFTLVLPLIIGIFSITADSSLAIHIANRIGLEYLAAEPMGSVSPRAKLSFRVDVPLNATVFGADHSSLVCVVSSVSFVLVVIVCSSSPVVRGLRIGSIAVARRCGRGTVRRCGVVGVVGGFFRKLL